MTTGAWDHDVTVAAIVISWPALHSVLPRAEPDLTTRLSASAVAGLHLVVLGPACGAPAKSRQVDTTCSAGRTWVTSESATPTEIFELLAPLGIGPGLVVGVGLDEATWPMLHQHIPAESLCAFLDDQLRRRHYRRVPSIDKDPAWVIEIGDQDPAMRRITESLLTVGSHGIGTRGAVEEADEYAVRGTLIAGVYEHTGENESLLAAPDWTALRLEPPPDHDVRFLDLRTGVLLREESSVRGLPLRTMRFSSVSRPGVVALAAEASRRRLATTDPLTPCSHTDGHRRSTATTVSDHGGGICAVAEQRARVDGGLRTLERIVAYAGSDDHPVDAACVTRRLDDAPAAGFDALLREQRAGWGARWQAVDVRIPDDPEAQLACRYALFQLWTNVNSGGSTDELAVGARGLSGGGYRGHVFWDADVFVAPAMASIDPAAAHAMTRYRLRRLTPARERAAGEGRHGARFPWESASTGVEVTPRSAQLGDDVVPILTGLQEEHITADVAWSAQFCDRWTGSVATGRGDRTALLVAAARYWVDRLRVASDGSAHIDAVIGPDEYHVHVDDNAFTNVMARWNLRAAADAIDAGEEAAHWRDLADRLVDGFCPANGVYEQFRGYFDLEPLLVTDYADPPVAIDLLLGPERVASSQLIKQPDALMAFHMVPDEMRPWTLGANLDFYEPRTAHGSSLSPALTASLYARAGRPDEGLVLLRQALRLDLGDTTGMTAAGLHLANLGGVWQALLHGFAGVSVRDDTIAVDPALPAAWPRFSIRFRALGAHLRLDVDHGVVQVDSDRPVRMRVGDQPAVETTHQRCTIRE